MKTKEEILIQVLRTFKGGNSTRAVEKKGFRCSYLTKDGKKCAVGLFLKPLEEGEYVGNVSNLGINFPDSVRDFVCLDDVLQDEYKHHSLYFWADLQRFHDENDHFTETGFSAKGLEYIKDFCKKYDMVFDIIMELVNKP